MTLSNKRKAVVEELGKDVYATKYFDEIMPLVEKALSDYTQIVIETVNDWYTLPPKHRTKERLLEELSK